MDEHFEALLLAILYLWGLNPEHVDAESQLLAQAVAQEILGRPVRESEIPAITRCLDRYPVYRAQMNKHIAWFREDSTHRLMFSVLPQLSIRRPPLEENNELLFSFRALLAKQLEELDIVLGIDEATERRTSTPALLQTRALVLNRAFSTPGEFATDPILGSIDFETLKALFERSTGA